MYGPRNRQSQPGGWSFSTTEKSEFERPRRPPVPTASRTKAARLSPASCQGRSRERSGPLARELGQRATQPKSPVSSPTARAVGRTGFPRKEQQSFVTSFLVICFGEPSIGPHFCRSPQLMATPCLSTSLNGSLFWWQKGGQILGLPFLHAPSLFSRLFCSLFSWFPDLFRAVSCQGGGLAGIPRASGPVLAGCLCNKVLCSCVVVSFSLGKQHGPFKEQTFLPFHSPRKGKNL